MTARPTGNPVVIDVFSGAEFTPVAVTLRDRRRVVLRSIRPDDRDDLQAAFGRLSGEARYMRFMAAMKSLSPAALERAVQPVAGRDLALVALEEPVSKGADGGIVAGARYIADPDLQACEFGITVADDWRRVGLASRLMKELIRCAHARKLKGMEGFVLARNTSMLDLARRLGFEVTAGGGGPGVARVWLDLRSGKRDVGQPVPAGGEHRLPG